VGSKVYIFGGKENGYSNRLFALDLEKERSKLVETTGDIPTPRYGHTSVEHDNKLYVFGGYDNETGVNNDFCVLDLEDFSWHKITSENTPDFRFNHFSILVQYNDNPCILIYGGKKSNKEIFDDIHLYDINNKTWNSLNTVGSNQPIARSCTKGFVNRKNLIIYGGTNQVVLSDIWELNFKTLKWKQLTQSSSFGPRSAHELIYDNRQLYIIGGQKNLEDCSSTIEVRKRKKLVYNFFNSTDFKVIGMDFELFKKVLKSYYNGLPLFDKKDESFINYQLAFGTFDFAEPGVITNYSLLDYIDIDAPFTDCQVVLSDDTVRSHRVLLIFACQELEKHLEGDTFNLSHFTLSQFNLLRKLFYSNNLDRGDINEANALDMLTIANDYKIERLKLYCEEAIIDKTDFWDRFELLEAGLRNESTYLVDWVTYQFQINYEDVKKDTRFNNLEDSLKQKIIQGAWPGDYYLDKLKRYNDGNYKRKDPNKCIMM